ncbi:MAG: ribonuclease III [Tissierellia bacterium]|nr:ribonuclease III [Tissierellia bacterium]
MAELCYKFRDLKLLKEALCHSSYANETDASLSSNERLEFLGDAVLELAMTDALYKEYKNSKEGLLSEIKSSLVKESTLAMVALNIGLDRMISLGKCEETTGGRHRQSILADAMEAVIGAVFLDSDFETAKAFINEIYEKTFQNYLQNVYSGEEPKSALQKLVQQSTNDIIEYRTNMVSGSDHNPTFYSEVYISKELMGSGKGSSKKRAETAAARVALEKLQQL